MKDRLVRLLEQEVINSEAQHLVNYFGKWNKNTNFLGDYFQVP
jgi:hypothetical protein